MKNSQIRPLSKPAFSEGLEGVARQENSREGDLNIHDRLSSAPTEQSPLKVGFGEKSITKELEKVLANSYALSLKTQNYHWNVEGENFKSLHELFGEQYEELSEAIDEIAERIRALGEKVEASFENFQTLSEIKKGDKNLKSAAMVNDLITGHEILVEILKSGIKAAQDESDEASADMLIGRVQVHEKAIWMLRSSW
jgi:starvation-inducible DNA-binding protein